MANHNILILRQDFFITLDIIRVTHMEPYTGCEQLEVGDKRNLIYYNLVILQFIQLNIY